ncbi:MAG: hypothetical protein P0Y63_13590 [Klebsiella huaxiensis]|uniref:hypothetical protein n=1 Tax=Klebsiella huaxiensis TaxID=2153354 RepID=UPI0026F0E80B|nr:hypothetical protein [Klebsiella huaxiensis]WEJ91983.1 MAG: hypothetical protein P0Y63_13590 [Klebsiella huaxiensis]
MSGGQTQSAALTTALAFHYQVLIGIDKCFTLQDDQSIWFERDGDVSFVSGEIDRSSQTEVKAYSAPLTDHHENLWNTLNNWLDIQFKHEEYGTLILHTTQAFGSTTRLQKWNTLNPIERIQTLKEIYAERTTEELNDEKPKNIVRLQKKVMSSPVDKFIKVISKVTLFTEADDADNLRKKIMMKPVGIPKYNLERYLEGLIGFVYAQANKTSWKINGKSFNAKCEELTALFHKKEFTFPLFNGYDPTKSELEKHQEKLFVKKIIDIDHHPMIPEAIGNWLELQNSLLEQLDEYPLYAEHTKKYQNKIIKRFMVDYSSAQLSMTNTERDSKLFYNNSITALPFMLGQETPPIEYRNGLIHDAMDDEERDLKWRIEP